MWNYPLEKSRAVKLEQITCGKVAWPRITRCIFMLEPPSYQSRRSHSWQHLCQRLFVANPKLTFVVIKNPNMNRVFDAVFLLLVVSRCLTRNPWWKSTAIKTHKISKMVRFGSLIVALVTLGVTANAALPSSKREWTLYLLYSRERRGRQGWVFSCFFIWGTICEGLQPSWSNQVYTSFTVHIDCGDTWRELSIPPILARHSHVSDYCRCSDVVNVLVSLGNSVPQ